MPEPIHMPLPTDIPVTEMMTDALSALVFTFGENMVCAAEERELDRIKVLVHFQTMEGPGSGRRFRLEFSLEPEGELITH